MEIKASRERGRPRGRYHNLADFKALEYLALISMTYEIDSNDFFNSIINAYEHQESTSKSLSIKCCKKTQDNAIFLITKGNKVVAQFPIPKHILKETNPLKKFTPKASSMRRMLGKTRIENPQIRDLKSGMNRITLKAKVIEIPKPKTVFTRLGKLITVANAKVTDETGIIQLPLWNQQIETIAIGDTIQVENVRIVTFNGELQIKVGKGAQLTVIKKGAPVKQAYKQKTD